MLTLTPQWSSPSLTNPLKLCCEFELSEVICQRQEPYENKHFEDVRTKQAFEEGNFKLREIANILSEFVLPPRQTAADKPMSMKLKQASFGSE